MWESNPPCALGRNNGFEDRGAHQHPFAPVRTGFYPNIHTLRQSMRIELDWKGKMAFDAKTPSGATVRLDTYTDEGGEQSGPTPVEALVLSLGACTAMDVVSILEKMRQNVESYRVVVEWERGSHGVWPRPITKFMVKHVLKGEGLDPAAVEKAVKLSNEKYCSVSATLRAGPEIETAWDVER